MSRGDLMRGRLNGGLVFDVDPQLQKSVAVLALKPSEGARCPTRRDNRLPPLEKQPNKTRSDTAAGSLNQCGEAIAHAGGLAGTAAGRLRSTAQSRLQCTASSSARARWNPMSRPRVLARLLARRPLPVSRPLSPNTDGAAIYRAVPSWGARSNSMAMRPSLQPPPSGSSVSRRTPTTKPNPPGGIRPRRPATCHRCPTCPTHGPAASLRPVSAERSAGTVQCHKEHQHPQREC